MTQNQFEQRVLPLDRFLSRKQVEQLTSIKTTSLYEMIKEGTFPKPVSISEGRKAWVDSEVKAWMDSRIALRDAS